MVNLKCIHCQSENLVRNGKTENGKQRYLCNDCGKMSRDNPQPNGYSLLERETILAAYQERSSLRALTRTFGVARNTVSGWLKEGKVKYREDVVQGLEKAPRAFLGLFRGENFGKLIVKVGDDPTAN